MFNFKRRDSCFKCYASRGESERGGEGSDEISNILTKSIKNIHKILQFLRQKHTITKKYSFINKKPTSSEILKKISQFFAYVLCSSLPLL